MIRTCIKCLIEKEDYCFVSKTRNTCKACRNLRNKELLINNPDVRARNLARKDKWASNNPEKVNASRQKWIDNNPEYWNLYYMENSEDRKSSSKEWRDNNKERAKITRSLWISNNPEYSNEYQKDKLKSDLSFKLRKYASTHIRNAIKENGGSKHDLSILQYLPYTMQQLKDHIELLFEPWMNWNNWGKYSAKTWNDSDSSTWTWQIDHIVPHSTFKYTDMNGDVFRQCWALTNLRPLSAKQNQLDGASKTRHGHKIR